MNEESEFMYRALKLAARGLGHTRPNPAVGAVIAKGGKIIGEGWHKKAGTDHAEVAAIKNAAGRGARSLKGATIYVTLEPCSKPGRVGACTDAIIAAGISRVVFAVPDPNPKNRGKAKRVLAKQGIMCECWSTDRTVMKRGSCDEEMLRRRDCVDVATKMMLPFAKHVKTGLPYVTVKLAMSLDGRICDFRGDSKWISSAYSRRAVGAHRAEVDAIMVGGETVRRDNPSLLSHQIPNRDLVRVIVSRSGKLPKDAQVFTDGKNETLVFADAKEALEELGRRGFLHVYCEGGLKLAVSLAEAGLVDEWIAVTAPIIIGTRPISQSVRMKLVRGGLLDPRAGDSIDHYGISNQTAFG
ncbi:MAG: dihydrofolate reductase family protein [Kiritimatiellae bacterium]|nr:dihydrofolate reductase family protein [Kiritimatiellia bacterium]